jgi:AhpD family alkylhydroperoxidase
MNIAVEAPELSRALVALERELRIDPVLRELVKLRASILNGCAYCIDLHTKDARKADESEQRLYGRCLVRGALLQRARASGAGAHPTPSPSSPTRTSRRPPTTRPRAISTPRSSPT